MARAAALLAALAAVAAGGAPAQESQPLFGIAREGGTNVLVALQPDTLAPLDARRLVLDSVGPWAYSPDRKLLAIATGYVDRRERPAPVELRFVNLAAIQQVAAVRLGPDPLLTTGWVDPVVAVAWIDPQSVLVLRRLPNATLQLVTVNVGTRAVVRRQLLGGDLLARAQTERELVLLVGQTDRIVAPRLVVVDGSGNRRSVTLRRLRAGMRFDRGANPPVHQSRYPGLAVDADRRTAYAVDSSGLVAELRLDALEPVYHSFHGTFAKFMSGSTRTAVPLGNGRLAITGTDSSVSRPARGDPFQVSRPAGLRVVDVDAWTSTTIASDVGHVRRWRDGFIATGTTWDSRERAQRGIGLVAYDAAARERFRLFAGRPVSVMGTHGDRAYVHVSEPSGRVVVDLVSGHVIDRGDGYFPLLLLDR